MERTDNEIIKALEYCRTHTGVCTDECVYRAMYSGSCMSKLQKDTLDLINRQKAEIERLRKFLDMCRKVSLARRDENIRKDELMIKMSAELKTAKSEAIKEFAERLKSHLLLNIGEKISVVTADDVNNLVKEMTEKE